MYKHILIPIDGSPTADKAVQAGVDFARGAKARVTLFTAVPEYQPPGDAELMARRAVSLWDHERLSRDKAQAILQPAAERLRAAGIECQTAYAECNRPHEAIIDAARGARARLRPYPDVLARPARPERALVRKRDPCRAEALEHPHARVPLTSRSPGGSASFAHRRDAIGRNWLNLPDYARSAVHERGD